MLESVSYTHLDVYKRQLAALTTTGGTDSSGGANRSRGFDFNAFASELFSQVIVRKTPSAEIEEGSLGATVDLRTLVRSLSR